MMRLYFGSFEEIMFLIVSILLSFYLQVSHIYAFTFVLFFSCATLYANSTPIVELTLSYDPFTYLYLKYLKVIEFGTLKENWIFPLQHHLLE